MGKDRFGTHTKKKGKSKGGPSMRQREIKDIRKELQGLKRGWRGAKEEERVGLAELREILRESQLGQQKPYTRRKK